MIMMIVAGNLPRSMLVKNLALATLSERATARHRRPSTRPKTGTLIRSGRTKNVDIRLSRTRTSRLRTSSFSQAKMARPYPNNAQTLAIIRPLRQSTERGKVRSRTKRGTILAVSTRSVPLRLARPIWSSSEHALSSRHVLMLTNSTQRKKWS